MIKSSFLSILAASVIPLVSHGQEALTKPIGFQTLTIKGGNFNLVGINFLRPVIVSGALESATVNSVVDDQADFVNVLAGKTNLWVELVSGVNQGFWSIASSTSATTLSTLTDLSPYISAGDRYEVRAAATIADIFGATNAVGLMAGSSLTADVIWIPDGSGGFEKIYYATVQPPFLTAGWRKIGTGNADASATPVYHVEGIIIERRDPSDLSLTFAGTLKTTTSVIPVTSGFNYVERNFPVGATLGNSGLVSFLQPGSSLTADILWLPNGAGGYTKYYYASAQPPFLTVGWRAVGAGNADQSAIALTAGFIIERRGASINMKIVPDAAIYGGL